MPSPWQPSFEPAFVALAAVAVVLYARAWRAEPAERWRPWCFGAGVALIVVALNSPLGTIAIEYLVLFHLLQNVMISDWAPPLLLIGLTVAMRDSARRARRAPARAARAPAGGAPRVGRRVVRRPPRGGLRRGRAQPAAPRARARLAHRDRARLLVARARATCRAPSPPSDDSPTCSRPSSSRRSSDWP